MKKVVLKLDLPDDKAKQKAMKAVSSLSGLESISMDMKEKKLTVVGHVDPVVVVGKLRKLWHTDMLSVGPKEEKKDEGKKDGDQNEQIAALAKAYPYMTQYYPYITQSYPYMTQSYHVYSAEENPNSCVIS